MRLRGKLESSSFRHIEAKDKSMIGRVGIMTVSVPTEQASSYVCGRPRQRDDPETFSNPSIQTSGPYGWMGKVLSML